MGIYKQDLGSCANAEVLTSEQPTQQSCAATEALTSDQPTQESKPNSEPTKKQRSYGSPATELPTYYKWK